MTLPSLEQAVQKTILSEASPEREALEMLDTFASVGATRFALTVKREGEKKPSFRPDCSIEQLRPSMGEILRNAETRQKSVIVRPLPAQALLIQLDDLDAATVERVKPAAFLVICTSPGRYQAWVAVSDADAGFARRLRQGAGADPTASGATRISGSVNFKAKHAPAFPSVRTVHVAPGLVVRRADLEALAVVAPVQSAGCVPPPARASHRPGGPRRFPDYQRCLGDAPKGHDSKKPDRSKADFFFCYLSAKWGWSVEEIAAELLRVSGKAQENGKRYALDTAQRAAANTGSTAGGS